MLAGLVLAIEPDFRPDMSMVVKALKPLQSSPILLLSNVRIIVVLLRSFSFGLYYIKALSSVRTRSLQSLICLCGFFVLKRVIA